MSTTAVIRWSHWSRGVMLSAAVLLVVAAVALLPSVVALSADAADSAPCSQASGARLDSVVSAAEGTSSSSAGTCSSPQVP